MATAYIEEFESLAKDSAGHRGQIGNQLSVTTQTVSFTATHGESAAFQKNTRFVSITADGIFSYKFAGAGNTPTATTSHPRRAAGTVEYFGVQPGGAVSFVTNT